MSASGIIEPHPFELTGAAQFQSGIGKCRILDKINLLQNDAEIGGYIANLPCGTPVGKIGRGNRISRLLSSGYIVQSASINSIGGATANGLVAPPRIRLIAKLAGSEWRPQSSHDAEFDICITGEQFYRKHVNACTLGDIALLWHEPDNPFDPRAIAVTRPNGDTVGHLPRDSWLHEMLLGHACGYAATMVRVKKERGDFNEITLRLHLQGANISERPYRG